MKFLLAFLRAFFPFLFKQSKPDFSYNNEAQPLADLSYDPFPRGRFRIPAYTNGASRKKKSNRLRISKLTRNKHR